MKVLVANRSEIACRILRTLRDLSIPSVAVYTEPDANASHVWLADEAVDLGEPLNYLDIQRVIAAAQQTGATAIHPGYGFLSQSAPFVTACEAAGITFIGPAPQAMLALGDKRSSRLVAEKCGVPVVPGARECDTLEAARQAALSVGFPVLLKAAGGGGGKGMRRVDQESELEEAFDAARREAKNAFNDDRMLVEKYIHPARHIEVQILADGKTSIALGERECSLQRRYQKIIEESPSAAIKPKVREALLAAAVRLTESVGYRNAGTVEFLVGPDDSFYFLEVNTRLQVEHPVTEMLTGLDIVAHQIDIAHGGKLPAAPTPRGHAIEARLNAEDPFHGFLPSVGDCGFLQWPVRPNIRVDAGIEVQSRVTPYYDPMLAKIIAWGNTRDEARRRLVSALRETYLLGVTTNLSYLIDVLESDFFKQGETYTTTIEAHTFATPAVPAFAQQISSKPAQAIASHGSDAYSPWRSLGGYRLGEV